MENRIIKVIYQTHLSPTIAIIPTIEAFQGSSHGRNRGGFRIRHCSDAYGEGKSFKKKIEIIFIKQSHAIVMI